MRAHVHTAKYTLTRWYFLQYDHHVGSWNLFHLNPSEIYIPKLLNLAPKWDEDKNKKINGAYLAILHLDKRSVHWVMMFGHWVIWGPVIGNQEGPAATITTVLIAAVKQVAVKEQAVTSLQLNSHSWQNLA